MTVSTSAIALRVQIVRVASAPTMQVRTTFRCVVLAPPLQKARETGHSFDAFLFLMAVNLPARQVTVRQKSQFTVCFERRPVVRNPVRDMTEGVPAMSAAMYFALVCDQVQKSAPHAGGSIVKEMLPKEPVESKPSPLVEPEEDDPEKRVANSVSEAAQRETESVVKDSVPVQSAVSSQATQDETGRELEQVQKPVSYSIDDYAKALEKPVSPPPRAYTPADYQKALQEDQWAEHAAALSQAGVGTAQ